MSKHTPGPWRFNGDEVIQSINGTLGDPTVCSLIGYGDEPYAKNEDECLANGLLITAAPDLLYALEGLLAAVAAHDGPKSIDELGVIGRAMQAIKKAKGEE